MPEATLVEWSFYQLDASFLRDSFDCGVSELNDYLKKYATQYQKRKLATTYVAVQGTESKEVAGYCSISSGEIEFKSVPDTMKSKIPGHPIPVIRIGRLAVTNAVQGRGLGKELLFHALYKIFEISKTVGIFAATVDATNETAKNFYLRYSFIELQDRPFSLILPVKTFEKEFQ